MIKKQYVIGVLGVASLLLGSLVATNVIPGQTSSSGYDPWLDYNDDGVIDAYDLQALGHAYGSTGTPLNMPMALAYDSGWLNISDLQGQNVTVTHNLNLATDSVQTIYGKTLPASDVHQTYFGGTGYAPGWNATYVSGLTSAGVPWSYPRSVVQTSDGGYAMAGYIRTQAFDWIFWLVKTDPAGNHQWNQTYENTGSDYAYSVVQTSDDDGYALAGYTKNMTTGLNDFWLVKTDAAGNHLWNKTYRSESWKAQCYSLVETSDGGYALAGNDQQLGAFWLVKTNSTGHAEWDLTYGLLYYSGDSAYSVVQTADGGYAMAGRAFAITPFGNQRLFCLVKVDASGTLQWNKTYGPTWGEGGLNDVAYSLIETSDGGYALAGQHAAVAGTDVRLIKTDGSGNHQWNRTYSSGPNFDSAYSLVQTADGGYAMAGCANADEDPFLDITVAYADYWLVKTDSAGNVQWNRTFGEKDVYSEAAYSMVMTADGGFAIAGYDQRPPGQIGFHGWLVKTDAFGLCDRADVIEVGLAVVATTANALTLYRGRIDPYWNYVRVRIWLPKPSP